MKKSGSKNKLVVVGGPNGSGKTTLAREILDEQDYEYISADDIAYEMAPDHPASVKIQAGKIFFEKLNQAVVDQKNILIESTLSGKSLIALLKKFRSDYNYSISVVFIFLTNPRVCVERAIRVKKVVIMFQRTIFTDGLEEALLNFLGVYKELADHWHLYYTSEDFFQEVARKQGTNKYVLDEALFVIFEKLKEKYEQK